MLRARGLAQCSRRTHHRTCLRIELRQHRQRLPPLRPLASAAHTIKVARTRPRKVKRTAATARPYGIAKPASYPWKVNRIFCCSQSRSVLCTLARGFLATASLFFVLLLLLLLLLPNAPVRASVCLRTDTSDLPIPSRLGLPFVEQKVRAHGGRRRALLAGGGGVLRGLWAGARQARHWREQGRGDEQGRQRQWQRQWQ